MHCCCLDVCECSPDAVIQQIPNLIKNVMLILTSEKETDENRGEDGARSLWIDWEPDGDDEDDVPEKKKKKQLLHSQLIREAFMVDATMEGLLPERRKKALFRSRWNHAVRQCFSLSFPLAEGSVTGYLLYVGELIRLVLQEMLHFLGLASDCLDCSGQSVCAIAC